MISTFSWCVIMYVCVGTYVLMEPLVDSWYWDEFNVFTKIVGGMISILVWPLIFFM